MCDSQCHVVFMDNFVTSYDLLEDTRILGFTATDTVRGERLKKYALEEMK
jgi:hypothetical protein